MELEKIENLEDNVDNNSVECSVEKTDGECCECCEKSKKSKKKKSKKEKKPKLKDKVYRIKSISPMSRLVPYIMENRIGSQNFIFDKINLRFPPASFLPFNVPIRPFPGKTSKSIISFFKRPFSLPY